MTSKLFTPLNIGAFDLRHRLVMDWGQTSPLQSGLPSWSEWPSAASYLLDGLAICDPALLAHADAEPSSPNVPSAPLACWHDAIGRMRSARQATLVRLGVDLCPPVGKHKDIPDHRSIERTIGANVDVAQRAKACGFDGIELDGAVSGDTRIFLPSPTNMRSDRHDNPMMHEVLFTLELVEALAQIFGRDRVGVRLSPFPERGAPEGVGEVFMETLRALHDQEIAYVHLTGAVPLEPATTGAFRPAPAADALRRAYPGMMIASGNFNLAQAIDLVESRWADAICLPVTRIDAEFLGQMQSP